ncbi:MAG: hypothetical protein QXP04_04275, partial [Candidatus Nanoarchaeia archaeon]|nr:hypothetical protein [Candidatus Jingweiarchaeum tengchongense]
IAEEKKVGKGETLGVEERLLKLEEEIKDIMVQINALKELNKQLNERITAASEKIGELRGLFFERETTIKDVLLSVKKTNEIIAELEPNRIIEDRRKTLTELTTIKSKLLEYESIIKDLLKKSMETKEMFERLKNMSALVDLSKEIGEKVSRIDEMRKEIERYSHKIESMYVEMNRRFEDFPFLVEKVKKLDSLSLEFIKSLDTFKVKLGDCLTKSELATIEEKFKKLEDEMNKVREEVKEEAISKEDETKLREYVNSLQEEKNTIESTINIIEDQYREALISEKTYKEISDMAKSKLENVNSLIEEINAILNKGRIEKRKLDEMFEKLKNLKFTKE